MKTLTSFVILTAFMAQAFGGLNPVKQYEVMPDDYGMNYKQIKIPTEDELISLNAWIFTPSEPAKRIVIISDDGQGNMADNIEIISNFLSLGYFVISYDYRGFGESSDFNINPKFYLYSEFEKDLNHVINYVKKYHAKLTMLDLYGIGMGAGLSIAVACNNVNVKRVIADAPYYALNHMQKRLKEVMGESVLMPMGYNKIRMEPKYALIEKGAHLYGILVIIGETDPVIGPVEYKMFAKGSKPKLQAYIVPGAVNEDNYNSDKDAYFDTIKKFLKL